MNFYTSDLHFGHDHCLKSDCRPFRNAEEMDEALIAAWNARVTDADHIYILGDLIYKSRHDPLWYLERLSGRKHLIAGNHDSILLENAEALSYFESVDQLSFIYDEGAKAHLVLCHYPLAEWHRMRHGALHLYGHVHSSRGATYDIMKAIPGAYNASVTVNKYAPATLTEIMENNRLFRGIG